MMRKMVRYLSLATREADRSGYDDVIYPVDYRVAGHIVDDDMHSIMFACRRLSVIGSD